MTDDKNVELIRQIVQRITNTRFENIDPTTRTSDLGIDSLLLAEVIVEIEETLGIDIEFGRWLHVQTVADLLRVIDQSVATKSGGGVDMS